KALDYFQTQIFDDARHNGERDPYDAYRADALVAMARAALDQDCTCDRDNHGAESEPGDTETPTASHTKTTSGKTTKKRRRQRRRSSSTRHTIVITVPHTTFLTGQPLDGETCQIPGVGPVPISVVHRLMDH